MSSSLRGSPFRRGWTPTLQRWQLMRNEWRCREAQQWTLDRTIPVIVYQSIFTHTYIYTVYYIQISVRYYVNLCAPTCVSSSHFHPRGLGPSCPQALYVSYDTKKSGTVSIEECTNLLATLGRLDDQVRVMPGQWGETLNLWPFWWETLWKWYWKVHDPNLGCCTPFFPAFHRGFQVRTVEEQQDLKQLLKQAALRTVPICSNHQYKKREKKHPSIPSQLPYFFMLRFYCDFVFWFHAGTKHSARRELSRKQLGSMLGSNWFGECLKSQSQRSWNRKVHEGADRRDLL